MAVKVGVAGLRRGRGPLGVLAHHPEAEVVAVADPNPETRAAAAEQFGVATAVDSYEALLECGLDAVVVATPAPLHAAHCIAALESGIHVLSEVPAVGSLAEARELVAAVRRATASYSFGENVNYFPRTVAWKEFIDQGKIGSIFYAEAEYIHDCRSLMRNPDGSRTWRHGRAPIWYCTHSLGPLLAWTGDRCVSTTSLHTGSHNEEGTIDMEAALFRTASGGVFKVLCGFSMTCEPGRHYYCVYGTKGMLESGRTADSPDRGYLGAAPEATRGPAANVVPALDRAAPEAARLGGHGDSEWFMIDDWLRSLVDGTPPPIDVHAGLDMTLPGICAHESAEQGGQPVAIPNSRDW